MRTEEPIMTILLEGISIALHKQVSLWVTLDWFGKESLIMETEK